MSLPVVKLYLIWCLGAFLAGSIPFGLLLVRLAGKGDVRAHRLRQHRRHQRDARRRQGPGRRHPAAGRGQGRPPVLPGPMAALGRDACACGGPGARCSGISSPSGCASRAARASPRPWGPCWPTTRPWCSRPWGPSSSWCWCSGT